MNTDFRAQTFDRRWVLLLVALTLLAWWLRVQFVLATEVQAPIRGDVRHYVAYAWNLLHHGVFSQAWPGSGTPTPDAFRSPGYPWFLAAAMALAGDGNPGWYGLALQGQALLGALTVTLVALLGRQWLAPGWALVAGALTAIWPHHIAATGALLGEVLFGFALVLSLWLAALALQRRRTGWAVGAGLALAWAALVNPVSLLFPVLVALVFWRDGWRQGGLVLLLAALAAPAAWGLRGIPPATGNAPPGRAALNLVQGSWPLYHEARRQQLLFDNAIAGEMLRQMDDEAALLSRSPASGLHAIGQRLSSDPAGYLRWYLVEKPFLLWDWDIRLGIGDVYFHRTRHSPLETNPILRTGKQVLRQLNPVVFGLSAVAAVVLMVGWLRRRPWSTAPVALLAALSIYLTAVHLVFQAEPRYATAYRPLQMLLLASALTWLAGASAGLLRRYFPNRRT